MSKYTTGEIAKLCGVSVRTVQYYDSRNILVPSELSEGGRRLYFEDDLKRMKIICFLRGAGLSINSISELLTEENPGNIISVLIEQQEQVLREELSERQTKLDILKCIKREVKEIEQFSVESIGDIAHIMKNKNKMARLRFCLFSMAVVMELVEIATVILWWKTGIWWPFAVGMVGMITIATLISVVYYKKVAYICPDCHEVFQPRFREAFWAYHTLKMRRLTCPKCGRKGLCVEVYADKEGTNDS